MPSPIAHAAVGYVMYRIFRDRLARAISPGVREKYLRPAKRENMLYFAAALLFSLLPDADSVPGLLFRDFGRFHNNISHSLIFCLAVSLVVGAVVQLAFRRGAFLWAGFALACCVLHVTMDFFTIGRGVKLFWPFTPDRFLPPFFLFYGVNWAEGWRSQSHFATISSEAAFLAILALFHMAAIILKRRFGPGESGDKAQNRSETQASDVTVIFDLDGLLSDTERLHRFAYQGALAAHGVVLTDEAYDEHWIRLGRGIADFIRENNLSLDPDSLRKDKAQRYRNLVKTSAVPMPGAVELLGRLRGRVRIALATSSYPDDAHAVLSALGIRSFFELVATKGDVERLKPWPDIFLFTARRMGVEPSKCVVFEDSEKGVIAAADAGMKVIAVPNEHTRNHDFSRATKVCSSLSEVALTMILSP